MLDALLVLAVTGVAVAAIVSAVRVGGEGRETPVEREPQPAPTEPAGETGVAETEPDGLPPLLPLPGDVREAGGLLWWVDRECRLARLAPASGAVEELAGEHCRVWPSPDGTRAVAVATRRSDALEGRGLVELPGGNVIEHTPGFLASEVAWAPHGLAFAVCFDTGEERVIEVNPSAGAVPLAGACQPAWLPDGRLAYARESGTAVAVYREELISPEALAALLPSLPEESRPVVTALGSGGGLVAVAVAAVTERSALPLAAAVALFSPQGELAAAQQLAPGVLPTAVGVAPDGSAFWYFDAGRGRAVLADPRSGQALAPFGARWLAWAPGGGLVAASTERGIVVARWPGGEDVALVEVEADVVVWTEAPAG